MIEAVAGGGGVCLSGACGRGVGEVDRSVGVGLAAGEGKPGRLGAVGEQALAGAEREREHEQVQCVDQPVGE